MLIRSFWVTWLDSRRWLNRLGRELVALPDCATPARRRRRVRAILKIKSQQIGMPWRQLLALWAKSLSQQGIDQTLYGLIAAPVMQPVALSELDSLGLVSAALDGCLHADALLPFQQVLQTHPQVMVIYTDHDYLDASGQRCQPHFKPDWNPDLFYSHDYIGPSVFFRRSWLESLPEGVRQLDGDTLFRVLPYLEGEQIVHIPRVLYHCENLKTLTPTPLPKVEGLRKETSYSPSTSGRGGRGGRVFGLMTVSLPTPPPLVSLIIPTRDRLDLLKPCVDSILQLTDYAHYEILIVDNGSEQDETHAWFTHIQQADPRVRVLLYPHEFNYSAINNHAVRHAKGSVVGLINNDIEVISPGWLTEMVRQANRPDIGCVGAKLYYPNGTIQHAGVILGSGGGSGHAHRYFERDAEGYCGRLKLVQNMTAVTGACLLVRKALFEQVGGLNEVDLKIAWNDIDLCLKVRAAGYRNLWTPHAELYHHESVSRGRDRSKAQRLRYKAETAYMHKTWGAIMWNDPCYNPNLTVAREDFSLGLSFGVM